MRINRIGRRTIICMGLLLVVALLCWLSGRPR